VFDHVTIRASDRAASERFYDTVLAPVGIERTRASEHDAAWSEFSLAQAMGEKPVTRRVHVAFAAPSRAHVDEFWRAGTEAGYRDDGAPGPRPEYRDDYYGAFLLDPDGNSAEAVHHGQIGTRGVLDHLWIRVANVAAAKRFYALVAPYAGFRLATDRPKRVQLAADTGSFSLVRGTPTEHVHVAFEAEEDATVDAFHRELTAAGYESNGAPGERAIYHPGYYGAFVLDPDGLNVEVVSHNRGSARS
jgi:catechol 2,3-dioxygenase-like lactoylglutathione lyase family enzyme